MNEIENGHYTLLQDHMVVRYSQPKYPPCGVGLIVRWKVDLTKWLDARLPQVLPLHIIPGQMKHGFGKDAHRLRISRVPSRLLPWTPTDGLVMWTDRHISNAPSHNIPHMAYSLRVFPRGPRVPRMGTLGKYAVMVPVIGPSCVLHTVSGTLATHG